MNDILSFLGKAAALLSALVAGGIVKSSSGIVIADLLGDITAVIQGTQEPTADLVTKVGQLLTDLQVSGLVQGQFITTVEAAVTSFATFAAAIQSTPTGQPGIGPRETLLGVQGSWVFIPDTAEADVKAPFGL